MQDKDYTRALSYSFFLLKYRGRSRHEVRTRLHKKGFTPAIIAAVCAYLTEHGYINDENFAREYVHFSQDRGWGPRRIEYALKRFGISEEVRRAALKSSDPKMRLRQLVKLYTDRYAGKKCSGRTTLRQKVVRALIAKGFDYQDIFQEMEVSGADNDDNS